MMEGKWQWLKERLNEDELKVFVYKGKFVFLIHIIEVNKFYIKNLMEGGNVTFLKFKCEKVSFQ